MTTEAAEKIIADYIATFTPEQLKKLESRVAQRLESRKAFKLNPGPSRCPLNIRIVPHLSYGNIANYVTVHLPDENDLTLYRIRIMPSETMSKKMVHELLGMCALWDITIKDAALAMAAACGHEL